MAVLLVPKDHPDLPDPRVQLDLLDHPDLPVPPVQMDLPDLLDLLALHRPMQHEYSSGMALPGRIAQMTPAQPSLSVELLHPPILTLRTATCGYRKE